MTRDQITELLKNYRYYKLAIRDYEKPFNGNENDPGPISDPYNWAAPARVALYSDTPIGRGGGSKPPMLTGGWGLGDYMEYNSYVYAVERTECALELLTKDEREVVTLKWMDGLTLSQVGERKNYSREWAKKINRRALDKLCIALRFDDVPEVDSVTKEKALSY